MNDKITTLEKAMLEGYSGNPPNPEWDIRTEEGKAHIDAYNQGVLAQPGRENLLNRDLAERSSARFQNQETGFDTYNTLENIGTALVIGIGAYLAAAHTTVGGQTILEHAKGLVDKIF